MDTADTGGLCRYRAACCECFSGHAKHHLPAFDAGEQREAHKVKPRSISEALLPDLPIGREISACDAKELISTAGITSKQPQL
jgi:hypothetical protein